MKKSFMCVILAAVCLLGGCSQVNEITRSATGIVLYYDTITELNKNNIDTKHYAGLTMNQALDKTVSQDTVLWYLGMQPTLNELNIMKYAPQTTETDVVGTWLSNAEYTYNFTGGSTATNTLKSYTITSTSNTNTFNDYLYLMRALTLKFDECTTEIYKSGNFIIDNAKLQSDKSVSEIINEYYANAFAENQISIEARWVEVDYVITVNFQSPSNCSIKYEFKD